MNKALAERTKVGRTVGRGLAHTLIVLFFLSGVSGLIYQLLWLRLLSLVFGVTVYAASTTLAAFMTGLALGSLVAGRFIDRAANPLRSYGVIEILIGASSLTTPGLLNLVEHIYAAAYPSLSHSLASLTLVRFLFSFAILIVPCTLMGATLPIIMKSLGLHTEGLGGRMALLYSSNTAGAIVGTLLAGFVLIGGVGITASFWLAASLNVIVGSVAVIASLPFPRNSFEGSESPREVPSAALDEPVGGLVLKRTRMVVLATFAFSGLASLALEIVWFRVLVLSFKATTYAYTVMLAAFLSGIAAGSYLAKPLMRRPVNLLAVLAVTELAIGVVLLFSLVALGHTYEMSAGAEPTTIQNLLKGQTLRGVASFLAVFSVTLLLGIAFPIGLRLWAGGATQSSVNTGYLVGTFYSVNVFGSIVGAVAGGFLLLPYLGSRTSFVVIAAISLSSGLLLLTRLPRAGRVFALGAALMGVVCFLAGALYAPSISTLALGHRYKRQRLLWHEEGLQTTVSVHQKPGGSRVMYLDGIHQAEDSREVVSIHRQIGHMAMLLHHDPRRALVIGLGGGVTAGAVSSHAGVEVDVIELSEAVVRGSAWFRHVNSDVLARPNVRLRIDDGRNHMLLSPDRYDVITADIIHPFHAGSGNLYSAEYFRLAHGKLEEDGLMLQWVGPRSETQYKLILRTFLSAFPHTTLWANGELLVGTKNPLEIDPAGLRRRLEDHAARESLGSVNLTNVESLLELYTAGPEELRRFVGAGPVLTDDRPLVEYYLSLPRRDPEVDLSGVRGDVMRHIKR